MAWMGVQPSLGERQAAVYAALRPSPASNMELSKKLEWSINRVTPRVLELRKMGFVMSERCRPCLVTGRWVREWRCVVEA